MFVGLHATIAEWRQIPEWYLSEDEAREFFTRCQAVARHYNVTTTQKAIDWIGLVGCAGGMYGRRYAAWSMRVYTEQMERRNNVIHIRPQAANAANNPNAPPRPGDEAKPNGAAAPNAPTQPAPVMDYGSLDIKPEPDHDA